MKRVVVFLILLLAIGFAQENEESDPRAIIEKVRIYRLTQELDLTTEQAIQFFPKLRELQKIDADFRARQKQLLQDLRGLLNNDAPDDEIMASLKQYESILKDRVQQQLGKLKEIRVLLTPGQQAKYLIFQDDFEREIREMIKEVKKIRPRQ